MFYPLKTDKTTRTFPIITMLLIAINVALFVYRLIALRNGGDLAAIYGILPYELIHRVDLPPTSPCSPYLSLLTFMFIHGGFVHIIVNMLFFSPLGPNVEDMMGHIKFLIFYVVCGAISGAVYVIPNYNTTFPLVGSGGAVAGVIGAHLRALPGTRVLCLFFIFNVTLPNNMVIVLSWIIIKTILSIGAPGSIRGVIPGIVGFVFGMLFVRKFQKR